MPPRTSKIPKKSKALEKDVNEMEELVKMLRSQIDEEKAKVNKGHHWAAGAEGPITKFDPHSKFARNLIHKKKEKNSSRSEKAETPKEEKAPAPPPEPKRVEPLPPQQPKVNPGPKRRVEIIVEPQKGALWGHNSEIGVSPDDESLDEYPSGGALWGPLPDEAEERKKFQEEINKIRGDNAPKPVEEEKDKEESEEAPLPKNGGALWGPHPDEEKEAEKFQRAIRKFRGEDVTSFPMPEEVSKESAAIDSIQPQKSDIKPTNFTYFDMLVNKDILDDTRFIDKI